MVIKYVQVFFKVYDEVYTLHIAPLPPFIFYICCGCGYPVRGEGEEPGAVGALEKSTDEQMRLFVRLSSLVKVLLFSKVFFRSINAHSTTLQTAYIVTFIDYICNIPIYFVV